MSLNYAPAGRAPQPDTEFLGARSERTLRGNVLEMLKPDPRPNSSFGDESNARRH